MEIKKKQAIQSNPMSASVHWDFDDDKDEDLIAWFEKFRALPLYIRYGLVDSRIQKEILELAKRYNVNTIEKIGEISRIIREYFTEQKSQEIFIRDATKRVQERLGITGQEKVTAFVEKLWEIISLVKRIGRKEFDDEYEQLPIIEAIKKYDDTVADQIVTNNLIKLTGENKKTVPTVKHWLEDYFEKVGSDYHNSVERGKYLFESENTINLSKKERDNLSAILEAFDEKKNVFILKNERIPEIDFELTNEINGSFFEKGKKEEKEIQNDNGKKVDNEKEEISGNNGFLVKKAEIKKSEIELKKPEFEMEKISKQKKDEKIDLSGFRQTKEKTITKNIKQKNTLDLSEFIVNEDDLK